VVGGGRGAIGHEHDGLDAGDLAGERLEERDQRLVDEEDLVLSVLDDEFEVLREKPQVQRVQNGAHAWHGVIELEVPVVVPGQRRDAVARLHAKPLERPGEAVDAADHLSVGGAVQSLLSLGDDLFLLVQALDSPEHVLNRELVVLHQAFQSPTSSKSSRGAASLRVGW
jgi:hypothetical protein